MASPDPAALLGLESAKLLDQPEAILAGHRKPETMAFTPPSEWSERLGRTAPSGPLGAALRDHVERHDTHSVGCSQPLDRHDEVSRPGLVRSDAGTLAGSRNSDRSLSGNSGRSKQALRSRSTRAKRPPNASPGRGRSDRSHDPA